MKVFQVIECTGSYEDYFERVLGTYFNKDKATELMNIKKKYVEVLNAEYNECLDCDYSKECYICKYGSDGYCENETLYDDMVDASYEVREYDVIE